MPPKNAKARQAGERREAQDAENAHRKSAVKEAGEAADWAVGAKDCSKKQREDAKRLEVLSRKSERLDALALEEGAEKGAEKNRERTVEKNRERTAERTAERTKRPEGRDFNTNSSESMEYGASGVSNALDLLSLTAPKRDQLERNPERRVKSAYAAFEETQMPLLKAENPQLRLTQLKQALQKKWKKSPENPMNQVSIAFNATRDEEREMVAMARDSSLEQFRGK